MNIRIVFYLAILISFFSCDTRKIKINREDNFELVEYIDPDKWISTSRLELIKELEITRYQDSLFLGEMVDLLIDREGSILIVERENSQIHKYSSNGTYISSLGREGRGPCECIHPGPIFFYDSLYYLLSQVPPKLISFDINLNCMGDVNLQNSLFWVYRNINNTPSFFLTHERIRDRYDGYARTFNSFNDLSFILDSVITIEHKNKDVTNQNLRIVNYDTPKEYVIADDGKLWLNETTEYKIDLYKEKHIVRSIVINYPLEKYSADELKTYKETIEETRGRNVILQAGLQIKTGVLPEYHKAIKRIINFNDQIWVFLRKKMIDNNFTIHIYNINGELSKIISVSNADIYEARLFALKEGYLYVMGENNFDYSLSKYRMNFIKK